MRWRDIKAATYILHKSNEAKDTLVEADQLFHPPLLMSNSLKHRLQSSQVTLKPFAWRQGHPERLKHEENLFEASISSTDPNKTHDVWVLMSTRAAAAALSVS